MPNIRLTLLEKTALAVWGVSIASLLIMLVLVILDYLAAASK